MKVCVWGGGLQTDGGGVDEEEDEQDGQWEGGKERIHRENLRIRPAGVKEGGVALLFSLSVIL